jgi:hypothetical protein
MFREYVQDKVHRANFVQEGKKKNSLVQNSTSRRNLRERETETYEYFLSLDDDAIT